MRISLCLIVLLGAAFSPFEAGAARDPKVAYSHQEDSRQTVRIWGGTAVLTALLWAAGTEDGRPFEYRVWFSDVYVCTPEGWRYSFGEVGARLIRVGQ